MQQLHVEDKQWFSRRDQRTGAPFVNPVWHSIIDHHYRSVNISAGTWAFWCSGWLTVKLSYFRFAYCIWNLVLRRFILLISYSMTENDPIQSLVVGCWFKHILLLYNRVGAQFLQLRNGLPRVGCLHPKLDCHIIYHLKSPYDIMLYFFIFAYNFSF